MENGKKPIYPIVSSDGIVKHQSQLSNATTTHQQLLTGLSKREYFAGLAMQGLLSSNAMYNGKTDERQLLCQDAIAHADELLKQLEKTK